MATKTVTISARIPSDDAEFISQLEINGAVTPSDKLRALINDARLRHEGQRDYRGCMMLVQDLINPLNIYIREQENALNVHSEVVARVLEWLPDILAFVMSSCNVEPDGKDKEDLYEFEKLLANRVFRLMESMLHVGVTQRCPCYSETLIRERIGPILDLTRAIEIAHQQE
ncbi:MAG: hypothetical protein OQL27_13445 [Sedimenticola sp.]|nr:hypothetical protein [Sedimenticola sp.]